MRQMRATFPERINRLCAVLVSRPPRACQDDIRGVTVLPPYVPPPPPPTPPPIDAAAAPDAVAPAAVPDPAAAAAKGGDEGAGEGLAGGQDVDVADPAVSVR